MGERYEKTLEALSPDDIQDLVAKAFVLEAMTDKPGCTTRYSDLPGKPLQDFVIAGINSARYFRVFAGEFQADHATPLFRYHADALRGSNAHKSSKYINFGLLEVMFPVAAARLVTNDPTQVVDEVIRLTKESGQADVGYMLQARETAWSTSSKVHKQEFPATRYVAAANVWDFYMHVNADSGPATSNFQWTEQYRLGLPVLRAFFDAYMQRDEILAATRDVFAEQREANPDIPVGILADMCAAAIFLWLSFNEQPVI